MNLIFESQLIENQKGTKNYIVADVLVFCKIIREKKSRKKNLKNRTDNN